MLRIIISIILLALALPGTSFAQVRSRIDSLENKMEGSSPDERVAIFCEISELYWQLSFDTSLLMAIHANTLAEKLDNPALTSTALNMIGNAYYLLGDYPNSMDHYLKALDIREELGDSNNIGSTYNNIGAVFLLMNDEQKALDFFKRAGIIFRALGDDNNLFAVLNNIGAVYVDNKIYDTAYQYFSQAYQIAEQTGNEVNLSIVLTNLGEVTLYMGLLTQSEEYQKKAFEISRSSGDKGMMATILSNIGNLYLKQKKYESALAALQESLVLSHEINSLPNIRENYKSLSEYYSLIGEYKQALNLFKMYDAVKDSINSHEGMMQIKELELKFSARALQQEIELLRLDNEINSLKQNRLKFGLISLSVLILALILLFILYFQRNQLKRKTTLLLEDKNKELEKTNKKLLESEKHLQELNSTKDKFFSIIGHDLRNPLNALLGFSELISGNSRDYSPEEIQKYSKIINEAAKNIHLLIENLLEWSRSQSGNMEFNPHESDLSLMVGEIVKIFDIQAEKKGISIETRIPDKTTVFADPNLLSTIIRNLVNNAVKYTQKNGDVLIYSGKTEEGITLSVKDSGVGMDHDQFNALFSLVHGPSSPGTAEEKGTGLGLILCKEFIDKHKGKIWAESELKNGSTFHIMLPNKK